VDGKYRLLLRGHERTPFQTRRHPENAYGSLRYDGAFRYQRMGEGHSRKSQHGDDELSLLSG
jgi:hypothetical protein